jgi:hypothetical protein
MIEKIIKKESIKPEASPNKQTKIWIELKYKENLLQIKIEKKFKEKAASILFDAFVCIINFLHDSYDNFPTRNSVSISDFKYQKTI